MWKERIDNVFNAWWQHAAPKNATALNQGDLATFLAVEDQRHSIKASNDQVVAALKKNLGSVGTSTQVSQSDYTECYFPLAFSELDVDGDGSLSYDEILNQKYFEFPGAFRDFLDASDQHPFLSAEQFHSSHADITNTVETSALEAWMQVSPAGAPAPLREIAAAGTATQQPPAPHGPGLLTSRPGILLSGNRIKLPEAGKIGYDTSIDSVIMRVVKTFDSAGDLNASPASFNYSKGDGKSETDVTGALRLEYKSPSLTALGLTPLAGFEEARSGSAKSTSSVRRVIIGFDLANDTGTHFLTYSLLHALLREETDSVKDVRRLTGQLMWEPSLKFAHTATGVWLPVFSKGQKVYFIPRMGAELSNIEHQPATGILKDKNFALLQLQAGLELLPRLDFQFTGTKRWGLNSGAENPYFEDITLTWNIDPQKVYSITGSYDKGKDSPAFVETGVYKVGLGIKY
jgi:hypothetical protein